MRAHLGDLTWLDYGMACVVRSDSDYLRNGQKFDPVRGSRSVEKPTVLVLQFPVGQSRVAMSATLTRR